MRMTTTILISFADKFIPMEYVCSVCTLPGFVRTRESGDPKIVSSIYCLHRCAPLVTSVPSFDELSK